MNAPVPIMPAREVKTDPPIEVKITLNLEKDRLVVCIGADSVGLDYENGVVMGLQIADALEVMNTERAKPKLTTQ